MVQPHIGDHHTDEGKEEGPLPLGKAGQDLERVLAAAGNQADAGVQAGQKEDQSQQHNAHIAEQVVGDGGQCSGSVSQFTVGTAGYGTHMGDGTIHCQEEERGDSTGISDLLYYGGTLSHAPIVDVHGYDKAKVQGSNGIHGLVAAQEALKHRGTGR